MAMFANVNNIKGQTPKYPKANHPPGSPLCVPVPPPTRLHVVKAKIKKYVNSGPSKTFYKCESIVIRVFLFILGIGNGVLAHEEMFGLEHLSLRCYSAVTPKHCSQLYTPFLLRNYLAAFVQVVLGFSLAVLATTGPRTTIILGKAWISIGIIALIATTMNFLYFYVQDCNGFQPNDFLTWLVSRMVEMAAFTCHIIIESKVRAANRANRAKSTDSTKEEDKIPSAAAGNEEKNKCVVLIC